MTDIVPKVWGYEWVAFDNGKAAITILHIAKGRKTSLHRHPNKATRLIVLSGNVKVRVGDPVGCNDILGPLETVRIGRDIPHQTVHLGEPAFSEDGAWLMEIEEPSDKNDLVRMDDDYGRAGTPYETEVVPYTGEILQLALDRVPSFMGYKFRFVSELFTGFHGRALNVPVGDLRLEIIKDSSVKVSDFIADFIAQQGVEHIFAVSGGGSMHLVDSVGRHSKLKYIACHHEQAAAMAAEAYARLRGFGCCLVTSGPGGTNAITGVACAWVDSIPMLVVSGQVTLDTAGKSGLRQSGVQETDITNLIEPIVKESRMVLEADEVQSDIEELVERSRQFRPGPVWLDVPLDIQSQRFTPAVWGSLSAPSDTRSITAAASGVAQEIAKALRPVLILGHGVRLAGAASLVPSLVDHLDIPVVTSWTAADMLCDHRRHIGHCGIFGDRASNFAVQNADLLLVIGCRLSIPQTGHNVAAFARQAKIVMIDIDGAEADKFAPRHMDCLVADAKDFIERLLITTMRTAPFTHDAWSKTCIDWCNEYPVVTDSQRASIGPNSYAFIEELSKQLTPEHIIVTDMGTAFTCTFQAAKMKMGQRWITASGHAPMGYGLPGAIGAALATGRPVVCITGDGGLQFNVQELATIAHHRLPIAIFVLDNAGYLAIKHTQANHFDVRVGSDAKDMSFPDWGRLFAAYNHNAFPVECRANGDMEFAIRTTLAAGRGGPSCCVVYMPPDQPLIPRTASKKLPDGSIRSSPLEDMYPFLPRDEFKDQMIVPIQETLS